MLKKILVTLISAISFVEGYCRFAVFAKTPVSSHKSMRRLFRLTNGRSNDFISRLLSIRHPAGKITNEQFNGVLGTLDSQHLEHIITQIDQHGYYVFEQKLAPDQVDVLREFALNTPCEAMIESQGSEVVFNYAKDRKRYKDSIPSVKYNFLSLDLLRNKAIQQLLLDRSILTVAEHYLKCQPILDLVAMWWSNPSDQPSSEAAQLYHFDMDRIKFLKFFFYLSDVDSDTGPHCYVRGSCKRKPQALCKDGRIPDDEIAQHFAPNDLVEICGDRGTIIAVDTRGFHKGKPLKHGERLMLQFEFTNSMFGANYPAVPLHDLDHEFANQVTQRPRLFGLISK